MRYGFVLFDLLFNIHGRKLRSCLEVIYPYYTFPGQA